MPLELFLWSFLYGQADISPRNLQFTFHDKLDVENLKNEENLDSEYSEISTILIFRKILALTVGYWINE